MKVCKQCNRKKGVITGTENRNTVTYFNRRIGSTTYVVKARFCEHTDNTMQDRILHMIENELLIESHKPIKPPATHEPSGLRGVHP